MLHALEAVQRTVRLHPDETHVPIHLLQISPYADEGPGGPETRHEVRNRPGSLLPDLRTRRFEVGPPVRLVVVLVEIPILARLRGRQRFRGSLRAVGPLGRRREDELGSIRRQDPPAFEAQVRRNAQRDAISFGGPEHRERDPGVPGRRVEEDLVSAQARPFRCPQHSERGAVLHAAARIAPFDLSVQADAAR